MISISSPAIRRGFCVYKAIFENPFIVYSFYIQTKTNYMNTEIFSHLNWWAILVATVAYFILGAVWYSKALFGTKWAQLIKLDTNNPDLKKGMGKMMASTFLLIFIVCFALSLFIHMIGFEDNFLYGIKLGLLTGFAFATTAVSITYVYENKPSNLYLINNGYHVIGHVLAATILVLWR